MKKYIILLAAALLSFSGCRKGFDASSDYWGGWSHYNYVNAHEYMLGLADNLVTGALDELEWAFETNDREAGVSSRFDVSGGKLETPGVTWTVISNLSAFKGATIKCLEGGAWEVAFTGPFEINGNVYTTSLVLKAVRGELSRDHHYSWQVNVEGSRTERKGYSCTFQTTAPMQYNVTRQDIAGWDNVIGDLYMNVYKDREIVDCCRLSVNGTPSAARFEAGL